MIRHPIPPVFDPARPPRVLILGSFPSVRSREVGFFYGHPQNRFWRLMAHLLDAPVPETTDEKRELLLSHGIALWDVIASCEIIGSADGSITPASVTPTDLSVILAAGTVKAVYTNGKTAHALYRKHQMPLTGIADVCLPSTSPANAAFSLERLETAWAEIQKALRS